MSDAFTRFENYQLNKQIVSEPKDIDAVDPWEKLLRRVETRAGVVHGVDRDGKREWRVKSRYLLTEVIGIPPERASGAVHGCRLGVVMRKLGWTGPKDIWFGAGHTKGYAKPDTSG